jgi:putative component of toxin-antitoxin plasmid stabilization module
MARSAQGVWPLYWLLMGGTKGTQPQDVERAKAMKRDIEGGGVR